jgi:murein DD-endopeptidase MepM/ murein hydrolase activator NlpD
VTTRAAPLRPIAVGAVALAGVIALIVGIPLIALLSLSSGTGNDATARSPVDAKALDAWMAKQVPDSPLIGLGYVFVAEGTHNGLDPRALVAIAKHESVLGTAGSGANIHNAFGWGPAIAFPTWQANIATVARGLAHDYVAKGHDTLAEIQPIWAPQGAANDPTGLNTSWVQAVGDNYADLGGDPTRPITLAAQGGVGAAGATIGPTGLATPTGGVGELGSGPGVGTHSYTAWPDNWQSDRAVDILLPFGSPIYAIDAGIIARVGGDPTNFAGRFGGAHLTLISADDQYFYGHLSGLVVGEGGRVGLGQIIGYSGHANGVEHLHLGSADHDPVGISALK